MSGLMWLEAYNTSDSSSSESEEETEKRKFGRLPIPEVFHKSTNEKSPVREQNSDGKIRNFPHERGIWATYVYLPVTPFYEFTEYTDRLKLFFEPLELKLVDDFHISLTKTVILKHHWIEGFTEMIRRSLVDVKEFNLCISGLKVYVNEHKTRTFVSLKVAEGTDELSNIVNQLDICLREYNLETFYTDPSFHMSLLWCSGDKVKEINEAMNGLSHKLKNFNFTINFSYCDCTSGNKHFRFYFR
ncbi:hypothetical protein RUM44_012437 [Polyplax serrata]|uniref:U6 snRNA phosphodiesterase n=1 Tax=Polyplax serrata TaxID=468196 RepID=A0ABR1BBA9_POLSC